MLRGFRDIARLYHAARVLARHDALIPRELATRMPAQLKLARALRDRVDFAYMSDRQILDGGLKKVRALVKDPSVLAEVQQDLQSGRNAKVDGTPTLILTHRQKQYRLPSAAGYYILRQFLDQLLAN